MAAALRKTQIENTRESIFYSFAFITDGWASRASVSHSIYMGSRKLAWRRAPIELYRIKSNYFRFPYHPQHTLPAVRPHPPPPNYTQSSQEKLVENNSLRKLWGVGLESVLWLMWKGRMVNLVFFHHSLISSWFHLKMSGGFPFSSLASSAIHRIHKWPPCNF